MQIHSDFSSIRNLRFPVTTIGTFDGVHTGHRAILDRVRELADKNSGESVVLTFYPHPRMILQPEDDTLRLLNSPDEKARLLSDSGIDHLVIYPFSESFSRLTAMDYIRDLLVVGIGVKILVVGYDHRFGRNRQGDIRTLQESTEMFGFEVEEIPAKTIDEIEVSSTKIRTSLAAGDVGTANRSLGYNYPLSGMVVSGRGLGKEIGFPTANIAPLYPWKLIPARGVYAADVFIEGESMKGMLNIGTRPTVSESEKEVIEVHVLDLDRDLYGKQITIEFLDRIRNEKKFGSIDELTNQIKNDRISAEKIFAAR